MIIFRKAGLSDLTLERGALFPMRNPIEKNQYRYLTESGNAKVYTQSGEHETLVLKFQGLSRDNYDGTVNGLKTWLKASQINWAENAFTLIDSDQRELTVRYWADNFDMPPASFNRYDVTLTLKVEG